MLALEVTAHRERLSLFGYGGIGHPPPYPVINDVMLVKL